LLIPDHVESVAEVVPWELSFLARASPGAVGIALLMELPLLVRLSIDDRFIAADIEDEVSSSGVERPGSGRNPEGTVANPGRSLRLRSL